MATWNRPCLKLVSDGTAMGTRLLMPDGSAVPGITRIDVRPIVPEGTVDLVITFVGVELDLEVNSPYAYEFEKSPS